jgi:hypothetical protein
MNRIYYVNPESGEVVANIFGRAVRKTAYRYGQCLRQGSEGPASSPGTVSFIYTDILWCENFAVCEQKILVNAAQ